MRSRDIERLVRQLQERKVQIEHNIQEATRELADLAEAEINDEGDYAANSTEVMIDSSITRQQIQELREIDYALNKAQAGEYGTCEMCSEPVGIERLRVKPHAKYCIVCRETFEKNGR